MPDTVAAPPAAPVASAPAAPSAPAPAAPSTPAPPVASVPVAPSAPAVPAMPAAFDPKTSSAAPKSSDYPDTQEGLFEFTRLNTEWAQAHPDEAFKARQERMGETVEEAPKPDAPLADVVAKAEGEQPAEVKPPAAPPVAATPVKIDEWIGKSAELKAAFDKHPELRTEIMEMARGMEAAKPVLDIVGTAEEAQFAVDHANRLVSLQTNWMLSGEDPEMIGPAWDQTVEMFKERDANGAEVKGADGKPKLGSDFKPFVRKAASSAMEEYASAAQGSITALEAKLAGVYPSEEAKEVDSKALEDLKYEKLAFDFVLHKLAQPDDGRPQLPALPPDATEQQKAFQKTLEAQSRDLDTKQGKATTAERKAARATLDRAVDQAWTKMINDHIESHVKAMTERGEYLPDYVLNDKWINPQTQQVTTVSDLGMRVYLGLNEKIYGNPVHRAKLASLQALGAAGKEARQAELSRLTNLYLPKLLDARVEKIQDGIRTASKKAPATTLGEVARREPQSQGTVVPSAMSSQEVRKWAETEAIKDPSFPAMSGTDREAFVIKLAMQKKFGG